MLLKDGCVINALKNKEIDCLMHLANCFQTMGTGIAKDIATNYPLALFADQQTKKGDLSKLGYFSKAQIGDNSYIYNLYGQYTYGRFNRQVDYFYLSGAFKRAVEDAVACGCRTIGIPFKMGCMNAGGEWEFIEKIVIKPTEEEFKQISFVVFKKK